MTDPTISALQSALSLFKHDWVHKFFFETSPSQTLEQLNYALKNPCATTGDHSITSVPRLQTQPQPQPRQFPLNDSLREVGKFLVIPSFTTSTMTVGFEIFDTLFSTFPFASTGTSMSRMARDDEQGIFLAVFNYEDTGLTEICFCNQISPGCRSLNFMLFDTKTFRRLTTRKFDAELVRKGLVYSFCSLDVRPCPICRAQTFINCKCKLTLSRKMHPLDYDAELRNINSYMKTFEGSAKFRIYEDGKPTLVNNYTANMSITVNNDVYHKQNMLTWAMETATKNCSMNIFKLAVPEREELAEDGVEDVRDGLFGGSAEEGFAGNGAEFRLSDEEIMRLVMALYDASDSESDTIGSSDIIPSFYAPDDGTPNFTRSEKFTPIVEGVIDPTSEDDIVGTFEKGTENSTEILSADCNSSSSPNTSERDVDSQSVKPSITVDPPGEANGHACMIEQITARRLVPIAPATGVSSVRPSTFAQELLRKAEVRKVRNRASALRSNEKKRVYMKKLKEDIAAAGKLEAALREKEKVLRERNRRLRVSIKR